VLFGLLILPSSTCAAGRGRISTPTTRPWPNPHFTFHQRARPFVQRVSRTSSRRSARCSALDYPQHEIIVITTAPPTTRWGGSAASSARARDTVYRKSLPIDGAIRGIYRSPHIQPHRDRQGARGKERGLNAGSPLAISVVCTIDADAIFQENARSASVRVPPRIRTGHRGRRQVRVRMVCKVDADAWSSRAAAEHPRRLPGDRVPRAFVASRLGLSDNEQSLILSGVFSLFRRTS